MNVHPLPRTALALGEILWDILPHERLLGGAPANFCHRMRQLGGNVRMVSRVGSDAFGLSLADGLRALDFDLSLIQIDPSHPTGTVDVTLTPDGNPTYIINPNVAYDYLEATPELLDSAQEASFICFGTLIQRSSKARNTIYKVLDTATKATRFLDINLRKDCYSKETVIESLKRADILKLNVGEVGTVAELLSLLDLTPQNVARQLISQFGLRTVLVTLGDKGVFAIDSSGTQITVPGLSVSVVDTIGSGDSFSAGFAYMYLQGASLEECCRFGNVIGALNATKKGGMPDIPPAEVQAFIRAHSISLNSRFVTSY